MKNFVKLFLDKDMHNSSLKLIENVNTDSETNAIKYIQKSIFKADVVADFKQVLHSTCWSDEIFISHDVSKKILKDLIFLSSSNDGDDVKIKVFHYIFKAYALSNKECEEDFLKLFIVMGFILGIHFSTENSKKISLVVNKNAFENAVEEKIPQPTETSFKIINTLLSDLSNLSVNLNSPENQKYCSWFSELINFVGVWQPFDNIFLEIFSTSCEIDVKIFEGNLQSIFSTVFSKKKGFNSSFCDSYKSFLVKTFTICAKFQRSHKFISKFFSSLKLSKTNFTEEILLPPEFLSEFSNSVKVLTSKQSLSIFDILLQNLEEVFSLICQKTSDVEVFLRSVVIVTKSFLDEVKILSPNLSTTSAHLFIEKLKFLKTSLQKFANFLSEDIHFLPNNITICTCYLELCYYCSEIEVLLSCYKDFFVKDSSDALFETQISSCIDETLWNSLSKTVLKSKLTTCYSVCLQIALQRLRILKLDQKNILNEEPAQKIIVGCFLAEDTNITILDLVSPEDMSLAMEVLSKKQKKIIVSKILRETFKNRDVGLKWLSDSKLQENITFVVAMFSILMKETNNVITACLDHKAISKFNWLSVEYFDEDNKVNQENIQNLSEMIDALFGKKKLKKAKSEEKEEWLLDIVEVFIKLPLEHISEECRRLGLSFAVGIATISSNQTKTVHLLLESILSFINSNVDSSICFNIGLCIKWLGDVSFENTDTEDLRIKIIAALVRSSPNSKFGLSQIGEMIEAAESSQLEPQLKTLETQVTMYSELGKCWLRAKKRKSDNDLIGSYRSKLAKFILEKADELNKNGLEVDNYKVLFKVAAVNLNKAIKSNNEDEIVEFVQNKFDSFFNFAINNLESAFDESSVLLLFTILQGMSAMRKHFPDGSLYKIWVVFKKYEKMNWRCFLTNSTDEEFELILSDLMLLSKEFFRNSEESSLVNCFDIWMSFFEVSADVKTSRCQIALQKLFDHIAVSDFMIPKFQIRKKYFLTKFLSFCVANRKVILTSQMMDTVVHLIVESSNEKNLVVKDFHDLFIVRVEACSAILSRQFAWNKNKVHLTYNLFQHMLSSLSERCHTNLHISNDDMFLLSTCAFSLEKWVSLMAGKQKDFARIGGYFIATIISSLASATLLPAIKIHLINCLNHFLSMSDSHTNSYLLRVLKPGYQQVFSSVYEQFKKYYKFSGKV